MNAIKYALLISTLSIVLPFAANSGEKSSNYFVVYMMSRDRKFFAYTADQRYNCGFAVSDHLITRQFRKHMLSKHKKITSGLLDIYIAIQLPNRKKLRNRLAAKIREARVKKAKVVRINDFHFSCNVAKTDRKRFK